jgi:hypothetical protein
VGDGMSRNKLAAIIVICTIAIIAAIVVPRLIDGTGTAHDAETDFSNAISCYEAKDHVGERTAVYGTVVSTKYASESNGKPTFLDMCYAYPDPNRLTVIIVINSLSRQRTITTLKLFTSAD